MLQNGREGVLLRVIEHSWMSDNTVFGPRSFSSCTNM